MRSREVGASTAFDLHEGDVFSFGTGPFVPGGQAIRCDALDLTDGGLVQIKGQIVGGRDRGFRGSWSVQFTQEVAIRA